MIICKEKKRMFGRAFAALCAVLSFSYGSLYASMHPTVQKIIDHVKALHVEPHDNAQFAQAALKEAEDEKRLLQDFFTNTAIKHTQKASEGLTSDQVQEIKERCLQLMEREQEILTTFQDNLRKEGCHNEVGKTKGLYAHLDREHDRIFPEVRSIIEHHCSDLLMGRIPEEFKVSEEDLPVRTSEGVSTKFFGTTKVEFLLNAFNYLWHSMGKPLVGKDLYEILYNRPTAYPAPLEGDKVRAIFHAANGHKSIFFLKDGEFEGIIYLAPWGLGAGRHKWSPNYPINKKVRDSAPCSLGMMIPSVEGIGSVHLRTFVEGSDVQEFKGYFERIHKDAPKKIGDVLVVDSGLSTIYLGEDDDFIVSVSSRSNFAQGIRSSALIELTDKKSMEQKIRGIMRPTEEAVKEFLKRKEEKSETYTESPRSAVMRSAGVEEEKEIKN